MRLRRAVVVLVLGCIALWLLCPVSARADTTLPLLMTRNQLQRMSAENQPVRIIDARPPEAYSQSHIPGSVNYSARGTLRNERGMLPSLRILTTSLSRLGLSANTPIVIYDQGNYREAARLFWLFESFGWAGRVAVLEGGISHWIQEGRDVNTAVPDIAPQQVLLTIDDQRLVTRKAAQIAAHEQASTFLLDNRDLAQDGKLVEDELFSGAIPGALSLPWSWIFQSGRQFKTPGELQYLNHILPDKALILYCRNGYDSPLVYFAFRRVGRNVAVYYGGLDEWLGDKQLPVDYEPLDSVIK